ncbi:hypothetical protein GV827_07795 [Sulfitobacter sp. JBTF-M27]|uniref:Lipoprotein n=1 Tax=Sulfitobacter sediminilitoris TaxID=2698830 RepID=A0A6P0C7Y2_9RHOB|nr:hypothetical protein [Sulfitobacter sediminilitoris]NEK22301.1 hypothetical protein [Sulfitobacter sediminilitoris]
MRAKFKIVASAFAVSGLSGCIDMTDIGASDLNAANAPDAQARAACVRDVRGVTGNTDAVVQSSTFSEAGTEVILLVGGTGTWNCIAYQDGTTAGIMSITNEGTL